MRTLSTESRTSRIGRITLDAKQTGERKAGNPPIAFDVAGTGNVAWSRCCDTSQPKGRGNREHKQRPKPARQSPTLLLGGTMETAASFEARNAPSSYPTATRHRPTRQVSQLSVVQKARRDTSVGRAAAAESDPKAAAIPMRHSSVTSM